MYDINIRGARIRGQFQSIWLILLALFIILLGAFMSAARAEVAGYHPQYPHQGSLGTENRPWGAAHIDDLNVHKTITTDQDGKVSPYGTQFPNTSIRVNSYTQFTQIAAGCTVFVIDLSRYNQVEIDAPSIYASMSPTGGTTTTGVTVWKAAFSGVSVVLGTTAPTEAQNNAKVEIVQWGNNTATPFTVWVPQASGNTPYCNLLAFYNVTQAGTSQIQTASSVSAYPVYEQYSRVQWQAKHNNGVSWIPVSYFLQKIAEH